MIALTLAITITLLIGSGAIGSAYAYDDVWTATPEIVSQGESVVITGVVEHYKTSHDMYINPLLYKDGEFLRQLDLYSECCGESNPMHANPFEPHDQINWTFEMEEPGIYTLDMRYGVPAPSTSGFNVGVSWTVESEITIQAISEPLPELTDADLREELILEELIIDPEPIPQINSWEQKYNDIVSMMSATADKLGETEKKLDKAEKKLDQSRLSLKDQIKENQDIKQRMSNFNTEELESLQKQNKTLKDKVDNLNLLVMEQVKVIYKWVINK